MRKIFCASVLAACAIAAGCSSSSETGSSTSPQDDAGASSDDGGTSAIAIAASSSTFTAGQDTTFTGKGANDLGAIALTHGIGTIQFQNEAADAFFFNATPVPTGTEDAGEFAGDRDFEIIAAQPGRFIVLFITCTGPKLTYVFYESTDGIASPKELAASGTCAVLEQSTDEAVTLPAVEIPPPALVTGFSITGSEISFDGTHVGSASLSGNPYALYPFNTIDCTTCATPGWYELHSVFWDPKNKSACLGILYLEKNAPSTVELAYAVCLPTVTDPLTNNQLLYQATWTSP